MKTRDSETRSRRNFLLAMGAGLTAVVTTPEMPFLDFLTSAAVSKETIQLNELLHQAFGDYHGGDHFAAYAESGTWVEPIRLQSTVDSLMYVYGALGLNPTFSNRVGYREASQCTNNFRAQEGRLRPRYEMFTDIQRAQVDRNIAYMLAGNFQSSQNLYAAEGASQYGGGRAIALTDDDPAVMLAASALLRQDYNPSRIENARSLTLTDSRPVSSEGQTVGRAYETPVNEFVHIRRQPRRSRAGNSSRGVLAARSKRGPRNENSVYFAELYV